VPLWPQGRLACENRLPHGLLSEYILWKALRDGEVVGRARGAAQDWARTCKLQHVGWPGMIATRFEAATADVRCS
jgi:hypothetical protein